MKRLLVSCDDYIFVNNGHYYFKNSEWKEFYDRYLRVFDVIRICNRVIEEAELNPSRVPIMDERIEIKPIPIFHGPYQYLSKFFAVGKAMRSATDGCDAAVLRLPSTVAQRLSRHVKHSRIPFAVEVVFDAHDGALAADSFITRIIWYIIDAQMKKTCYRADGISCVTEKYLQKRYFSLKPNHFTSHYSTLSLNKSFYSNPRLFPDKKEFTIAHVDNQLCLNGRKGTKQVIDALFLLSQKNIFINAIFAGEDRGHNTQDILDYAKRKGLTGRVSCPGYLSRIQLSNLLDSADLFVLPTKAEGLPRVVIEAIAKGLPVVTSPVSGNPELISQNYLVDYKDVEGIAAKIEALVTQKVLYEKASYDNYHKSLEYESSLLEARRDAFYSKLLAKCGLK